MRRTEEEENKGIYRENYEDKTGRGRGETEARRERREGKEERVNDRDVREK